MGSAVRKHVFSSLPAAFRKSDVRTQFGALCYRIRNEKPQILLVTSRDTGRWIVPKGWPMTGLSASETAATEAWEEAGVSGKIFEKCVGVYSYLKTIESKRPIPVVVAIYPLLVRKLADEFPEAGQRRRKWFDPKKAASRVVEPELKQLLRGFDPKILRK